jgi:hypothetical protein
VSYSHAHFKRYRPRVPMLCSMPSWSISHEKPVWPFDPLRYSLQGVDLVPMLEISPQVVRERPKKSSPTQDATAVSLATEKRTSEFSSGQEGTA